jgi:hypothetical protein
LANIPSVKKRISEITLLQDKIPLVIDGVAVLEEISELNFDGLIPNQELIDKCLLLFELPDDFLDIDTRYFQQRIRDRKRKILKQLQNAELPTVEESKMVSVLDNVETLMTNLHTRANNKKDKGLF